MWIRIAGILLIIGSIFGFWTKYTEDFQTFKHGKIIKAFVSQQPDNCKYKNYKIRFRYKNNTFYRGVSTIKCEILRLGDTVLFKHIDGKSDDFQLFDNSVSSYYSEFIACVFLFIFGIVCLVTKKPQ